MADAPTPNPSLADEHRHIVQMSSGVGSAVAGKRCVDRFGADAVTLLFADVNGEDPDNYRFLREATEWIGAQLVVIDNDGRTIWDVFRDGKFLGNSRVDLCSRALKREPLLAWLKANCDPADTVVHIGFDMSEPHRLQRAEPYWPPFTIDAPLLWDPVLWKHEAIDIVRAAGIEPPDLTRRGYPHANCGGGCVKAGIGQFRRLYHDHPDRFAEWEHAEQAQRELLDRDVAILRDRRGGKTRPLTLRELRETIEAEAFGTLLALLEVDPGDSCNCMGDYETPVALGASDV